jgi:hypothetical protein
MCDCVAGVDIGAYNSCSNVCKKRALASQKIPLNI